MFIVGIIFIIAVSNRREPVASVFIMAASVISILVSISGLVGMRRKDPILVGLCACYWCVSSRWHLFTFNRALMTIFFLVVSISILVLNKHLFGQNLQCAVVTGVWCGLLWLMYIYSIPMIIILLSVTSPLLYFHLRHALDLRRSPTQSTQVALANVQRGEDRSPTSDL